MGLKNWVGHLRYHQQLSEMFYPALLEERNRCICVLSLLRDSLGIRDRILTAQETKKINQNIKHWQCALDLVEIYIKRTGLMTE